MLFFLVQILWFGLEISEVFPTFIDWRTIIYRQF